MKNNETNKYKYVTLSKKVFSRLCPEHHWGMVNNFGCSCWSQSVILC